MPDEWTSLLERAPMGPSTTRDTLQGLFSSDLAPAASCTTLKFISYCLRYVAYFYPLGRWSIVIVVLGEIRNCMVQQDWGEIALSFDAAVSKAFNDVFATPEQSDDARNQASRANRKATAIPDALQALLGLVDHSIISFMAVSKAGCSWPFACGASILTLCLSLFLQRKSKKLVSEVLAHRRQKETGAGKEGLFPVYANSSRSLRQSDCQRRVCVLFALGMLMFVANPLEPHNFMLALPLVLHTDEKLGKMWKATSDMESSWPFLQAHYPLPDQSLHQQLTNSPVSRPLSASRPPEIRAALREQVSGVAMKVVQLKRIWQEGARYKIEVMSRWSHSERTRNPRLRGTDMMV